MPENDAAPAPKAVLDFLSELKVAVTNIQATFLADTKDRQETLGRIRADFIEYYTYFNVLRANIEELLTVTRGTAVAQLKMRAEIMDRIDRLQEGVELVREDARVNWATADTAINRARNSREDIDDLQKQISAMERRYRTLAATLDELRKSEIKKPDSE